MKQHTTINLSISAKLLNNIEQNISAKNRSQKISKCAKKGYQILKEREIP